MAEPLVSDPMVRLAEVECETGMRRSTIYKRVGQGAFPAPYDMDGGMVRWLWSEVLAWKAARPRATFASPRELPESGIATRR